MPIRWAPTLGAAIILSSAPAAAEEPSSPAPLAGYQDGFFLRDSRDYFRVYPRLRLNIDAYGFFGKGLADVPSTDGGVGLAPRLVLRRFRLEIGADFFQRRVSLLASAELGGQSLANANGKTQQTAARPGQDPTVTSARYAPVESITSGAAPADVYINVRVADELNFMVGQYQLPFSMENRTSESYTPFMERNVAIRAFVVPAGKETGVTAWGDLFGGILAYEMGIFGGDGQNRPQVDSNVDFSERLFVRPLLRHGGALARTQIGMSARAGIRDAKSIGYDYPQITTAQGFVLWDPTYKDASGRTLHVIPSGLQSAVGGELRVPFGIGAVAGEAYYVTNRTREAVDGYQLTNTERLGVMRGLGWYGQISFWPVGDTFIGGDPGMTRPRSPDLTKPPEAPKRGLELIALVGGINARYDATARGGPADAKTPNAPITIYQYAFAATWWTTRALRATVNYSIYHTPGSGSADNLAAVPGNLAKTPDPGAHLLHELSARLALTL
ncbi:MAG: porin [Minicystis sp.]